MLPRRFALIRHVDYTGAAGTGVIAYGVAFDDGQVVLRWSSAHHATSVLDSVEDLIAAHGHGETTSIEWIDAPPGKSDAPAQQGGRRARRSSPLDDVPPGTEVPRMPTPPETAWTEAADTGPAAHDQQEPAPAAESAEVRPASSAPQAPRFNEPAAPAAFAQPAASPQPAAPPAKPSTPPNGTSSPPAAPVPEIPVAPAPTVHTSSPSNGTTRSSSSIEPADVPASGTAAPSPAGSTPERPDTTSRADRNGDRRARHEVIATQPMNTDLSEDRGQRRPRRAAAPPRESPRSIFEEAEEPARPDLRLASSNGRSREHDDSDDSEDTSPGREDFGGYFSPGHQHLDTVTGLLDLPAGLDKRGRGSAAEEDAIASRRNGRHRGE